MVYHGDAVHVMSFFLPKLTSFLHQEQLHLKQGVRLKLHLHSVQGSPKSHLVGAMIGDLDGTQKGLSLQSIV